jgi:hypothetical protein|tara:strand:+ start:523 stop:1017 length:495 start_codon:yes stop_codon:yes gene_type:complete
MPFCTIEEAWGENIYNIDNSKKQAHSLLYTDKIDSSTETDYLRPKDHSAFIIEEDISNEKEYKTHIQNEISKHSENSYIPTLDSDTSNKINDLETFIKKLKNENEELKNLISKKNIEQNMEKNSIKFKLIDIAIYLLTGIFIIFIIDLIFKHTFSKSKLRKNIF